MDFRHSLVSASAIVALAGCSSKPAAADRDVASSGDKIQCVSDDSVSEHKKYVFGKIVSDDELQIAIRDQEGDDYNENYPHLKFKRQGYSQNGKFLVYVTHDRSLAKGFADWGDGASIGLDPHISSKPYETRAELRWTADREGAPMNHMVEMTCRRR